MTLPDVSAFARALRADLTDELGTAPGHQLLLNAIARAGGYRNFQQLKATCVADEPALPVDGRLVAKVLARFDDAGRLTAWSTRRRVRQYCLWALWAQMPPRRDYTERDVSELFDAMTAFRDAAQIRRSLIEDRLLERERDGSVYRRVEASPDPTAEAIIRTVMARRRAASAQAEVARPAHAVEGDPEAVGSA